MRSTRRTAAAIVLLAAIALCATAPSDAQQQQQQQPPPREVQRHETPYYIMHTDLEIDDAREAAIRMTKMAEEYYERTKEFSGQINRKFPFYLYRSPQLYLRTGGIPGSSGFFDGNRLVAMAADRAGRGTWHVVQHEGFHQFAHAVIGGRLPVWVNEGLAEYFGNAVFTGDGFVTGLVPPGRLKRIQQGIRENRFRPIPNMMLMSLREWNGALSIVNYDQGWSMVHFLAHGEGGRYQGAFADFINAIGNRRPYLDAWIDIFGRDVAGFEQRWRDYWLNLPDDPTGDLYAKATTATLTSFLARAYARKHSFDTFEEFIGRAEAGELKLDFDEDWLPPSLLKDAVEQSKKVGKWSLEPGTTSGTRTLVCRYDEKTTWHGTFTLARNGRIARVSVDLPGENKPPTVARKPGAPSNAANAAPPARETPRSSPATRPRAKVATVDPVRSAMSMARLHESKGDKPKARAVLERALKENPDSPAAADAKAMLQKLKSS